MRTTVFVIFLLFVFSLPCLSQDAPSLYSDYDLAPGAKPGTIQSSDEQWELLYSWDLGNEMNPLGISFKNGYLWFSGPGVIEPMIYIFDPETGVLVHSFPSGATSAWGIRDMCTDMNYVCGVWEQGIYCWDPETYTLAETIPFAAMRALAYDPATDHFYLGNFGSTCCEIDRNGNIIRVWMPAPLTSIVGFAWDEDDPDGPWLYIYDQTFPVSGCNLHQMDPVTLTLTGFCINLCIPPFYNQMAAGVDYSTELDPVYSTLLVVNQGTPDYAGAFEMHLMTEPDIDITLTPFGVPITIPAGGGDFEFNISAVNNEADSITLDIWTDVTLPGGTVYGPIINVQGFNMLPGVPIDRDRVQAVPAGAPPGMYTYNAYAGDYPSVIFGEDHFNFEKAATGDGTGYDDWYNWGEAFPGEVLNAPDVPVEYNLSEAYPNPFNPAAHIGYSLPERAQVELIVYDVSGREVAVLVKGLIDAGNHQAVFDGAGLATGVYFYRLTAGDFSEVKKMVLVK